jgi:hypothetical protein
MAADRSRCTVEHSGLEKLLKCRSHTKAKLHEAFYRLQRFEVQLIGEQSY